MSSTENPFMEYQSNQLTLVRVRNLARLSPFIKLNDNIYGLGVLVFVLIDFLGYRIYSPKYGPHRLTVAFYCAV